MRRLLLLLVLLCATAAPAAAQRRAPVEIALGNTAPASAFEGPVVTLNGVLDEPRTRELLRSGFPAQLRFRMELWREGGWFDDMQRFATWDFIIAYDPGTQRYRVRRRSGSELEDLGTFASIEAAAETIERPHRIAMTPTRGGRHYYTLALDVETLSVSDLDQLERWLRGELRPAVSGRNNPASAVGNGVRTLVTRVLGGEKRRYETRSPSFRR